MAMALNKKTLLAAVLLPVSLGVLYFTLFSGEGSGAEPDEFDDEEYAVEDEGMEVMDSVDLEAGSEGNGTGTDRIGTDGGFAPAGNIEEVLNKLMDRKLKMLSEIEENNRSVDNSTAAETAHEIEPVEVASTSLRNRTDADEDEIDELRVRGIMAGGFRSRVLIDGYILKEGDLLPNGYSIVRIDRKSIVFRNMSSGKEVIKLIEPLDSSRRGGGDEEEEESSVEESEPQSSESEPADPSTNPSTAEGDQTS